jgi:ABC-2 type transport system permease protein
MTVLRFPFIAVLALKDNAAVITLLSLGILALAAVAMVFVGARIYEGSLLRTNGRTEVAAAWRDREAARLAG